MMQERQRSHQELTQDNTWLDRDEYWMHQALLQAEEAGRAGEVPVGAVLVKNKTPLAAAGNSSIGSHDPTSHAEIIVVRTAAKRLQNYRLPDTTLYVTLEPCVMCMGALIHARVERLVYGATDPKSGGASSAYAMGSDGLLNHNIILHSGILADQCGTLLSAFFKHRRRQ